MKRSIILVMCALVLAGTAFAANPLPTKDQVLNIAHPELSQSWSPFLGGGHVARWNSLWWAAPMYFDKNASSNHMFYPRLFRTLVLRPGP